MTASTIAGRYSRDAEIGRGGMGAVWRGTDTVLGRTVAIKRVGVAPGGAAADTVRAEREARLAARLNDPHVVSVFDLVDDGDQQWLVMEYVEGTDLAELIRRQGALTPDEVAPILAQVAAALAAAHTTGIVHRDVKPSNVLVTPAGHVKLSDFGIARTQADAALTQTGLVTGSPAYLSPEVASGQLATPASDVWSLGASLFHALEGRPPYDLGDNLIGGLYRIVHEEVPRPGRPGWLAPVLAGTMTHTPGDRWTAAEVQGFLERRPDHRVEPVAEPVTEPVAESPVPALVPTTHRGGVSRVWWVLALAAVVALAVVGWGFAVGFGGDSGEPGARGGATGSASPRSPGASTDPGDGSTQSPTGAPTAATMTDFLASYLQTVVTDRQAAFGLLTAAYQQRSGGLSGYQSFWGPVSQTQLISAVADPASLTVSYTYRYVRDGKRSAPETHQLQLAYADGQYLIAGQT